MNHYEVLSIPSPPHSQPLSSDLIKRAYHAALLSHHPDKKSLPSTPSEVDLSASGPSVDAIKLAYDILSHPATRLEYDRKIRLDQLQSQEQNNRQIQDRVLGNEAVDLDDMVLQRDGMSWRKACRCGDPNGYIVTERELEDALNKGDREVVLLCGGCSLGVRVLFGVIDDEDGIQNQDKEGDKASG